MTVQTLGSVVSFAISAIRQCGCVFVGRCVQVVATGAVCGPGAVARRSVAFALALRRVYEQGLPLGLGGL